MLKPRSRASAPCQPRQPRKVGPPTSVGQQPGPIARFAGVGRRRKRRFSGLATAQEHAPCSGFVGCSLIFYYSRFCIRLHFRARTVDRSTSCWGGSGTVQRLLERCSVAVPTRRHSLSRHPVVRECGAACLHGNSLCWPATCIWARYGRHPGQKKRIRCVSAHKNAGRGTAADGRRCLLGGPTTPIWAAGALVRALIGRQQTALSEL